MNIVSRLIYITEAAALSTFILTMLVLILSPFLFILATRIGVGQAGKDKRAEGKRKQLKLVKGGKKR